MLLWNLSGTKGGEALDVPDLNQATRAEWGSHSLCAEWGKIVCVRHVVQIDGNCCTNRNVHCTTPLHAWIEGSMMPSCLGYEGT